MVGDTAKPTVLIVDDDEDILSSLEDALSESYAVHTCNNALAGVGRAREVKPTVIILDVRMPVHDGFWLFHEIRKFDAKTPIIMNSAYHDSTLQPSEAFVEPPFAYLHKSTGLKHLMSTLAAAVERKTAL